MSTITNVAVLIDADNVSPSWIERVLHEASTLGTLALKRVYGDFSRNEKAWKDVCARLAIQPIQQFPNTTGKNASDIALVIDGMDLLHSHRYASFCLVSSDSDFSRLATRLREDGVQVWGFGEQKTPQAFVKACTKFVYVEILQSSSEDESKQGNRPSGDIADTENERSLSKLSSVAQKVQDASQSLRRLDKALWQQLSKAIESIGDEEGWANLGGVGSLLSTWMPDFDARNYGFKKLSELVVKSGWFETQKLSNGKSGLLLRLKASVPGEKVK